MLKNTNRFHYMKTYFVNFLSVLFLLNFLPHISFAQLSVDEKKIFDKYISQDFPKKDFTGNDSLDSQNHNLKLRSYCKTHRPFPKLHNKGYSQDDINNYNTEVNNWILQYGNDYPIFIEYYLYGKAGRTLEDDILSYNSAKKEWIKSHPDQFKEFEPILKKMETPYFIPLVLPDDFPSYVESGDSTQDFNQYLDKIKKWKINHPEFKNIVIQKNSYKALK